MVVAKKPSTAKTAAKPASKTPAKAPRKVAAKAPRKAATKVANKPAAKAPVKSTKVATAPKKAANNSANTAVKAAPEAKVKKPKLVRDSFTMPKSEYAVIDELKQRAAKLGHPIKKSELLRAAIKVVAGLSDAAYIAAMSAVPPIKTGRPSKS